MICDPVKSIMKVSEAYDSVIFQRKPGMRHVVILGTILKTIVLMFALEQMELVLEEMLVLDEEIILVLNKEVILALNDTGRGGGTTTGRGGGANRNIGIMLLVSLLLPLGYYFN